MKRVLRFIKAIWRYLLFGKRVTFDDYATRLNSCRECQYMNKEKWTCDKCGCYLVKKCKMSTEKCPIGKWLM